MTHQRKYWNMEIEPILNTPQMKKIQLIKIKELVVRLYENSSFWKAWMQKAKVKPEDIKTLDDFGRRIPVFDKAQHRQLFEECHGDMTKVLGKTVSVPLENLRLIAATSGTTGEPTPYVFTDHDIEVSSEIHARMLWRIGVRPESRIIHAFGLSMWLAGVPYAIFSQKVGACILPVGAEGGTERILRFAKLFKADTLACTPSLAEHIAEKAPEKIGESVKTLAFERLFCAGEPGAGIPEVRKKLESAYGAKVYDHGSGSGISCDSPVYQGMHHVADDKVYYELVHPETGEPIPFEDGAEGVPVQTTLEGEGALWFRESLGDIATVHTEPCPCGQTGFRYKIIGRIDDMLKIKGVIVYPAAIDGVITSFVPRVTGEFRITLDAPPPRVIPPLKLKIEYGENLSEDKLADLANEIEDRMSTKCKFRPQIQWLPPNSLERSTQKTTFFERLYEKNRRGK